MSVIEFLEAIEMGKITGRNALSRKYADSAELCERGGYFVNDGGVYRLTREGECELALHRMREQFQKESGLC